MRLAFPPLAFHTLALALLATPLHAAPPKLASAPVVAMKIEPTLQQRVEAMLAAAPAGTRYGMMVTTLEGTPVLMIAPDQRFIPGSNTKMFTTATAYANLAALDAASRGTGVRLQKERGRTNVVLVGRGDARLSSAAECMTDCLATLADAVAARTRTVNDIIGDDSWFPDERWSPGMSWNNIPTRSGTGISALTLDDNELAASVTPGKLEGAGPIIVGPTYYQIDNQARNVPGGEVHLQDWRDPASFTVRIMGTIGMDAPAQTIRFGIDDPAHYAAFRFGEMLKSRGVRVKGTISVRHRPLTPQDDPKLRGEGPVMLPPEPEMLAQLPPLPLSEDIYITNKVSQNLHAELLLRRVGRLGGTGSIADGQATLRTLLSGGGVPDAGYDLSDGSGMSSYNRVSPRGATALLGWIARQPWGSYWRTTLPIGGRDGTLRRRFAGTSLEGRLFAKTGTLNASSALSGYLTTRSGTTLIFSAIANDVPDAQIADAIKAMDAALVMISEAQ